MNFSRRLKRRWLWFAPFLFLLFAFVSIALTPVTIIADRPASRETVTDNEWEIVPTAVPSEVTVSARGRGTVLLGTPRLRWPEVFGEELVDRLDGFRVDLETGGYSSRGKGTIIFRGVFGPLTLELLPSSTATSVIVSRSTPNSSQRATLSVGESLTLPSPDQTLQRTTSFLWRSIPSRLNGSRDANIRASLGRYELPVSEDYEFSFRELAPKATLLFLQGVLVFIAGMALILFGWGVVRSLDPTGKQSLRWLSLQAVAGVALIALVANSLSYFIPTAWVGWLIILLGSGLIFWRLLLRRGTLDTLGPFRRLSKGLCLALLPALFMFFPILHWGGWYAGRYNTDLFEYAHLSSLLRESSLFGLRGSPEALNSGVLTAGAGFEWRSIDSVLASTVSVTTFSSTISGVVIVSIAAFLLFALSVLALSEGKGASSRLLALLLLISPAFVALFIENYQSHYFFVAFIPGLVLAFKQLLPFDSDPAPAVRRYHYLLIGSLAGVALAAYPYFAVVAFLGLAIPLILLRHSARSVFDDLFKALIATIALFNIGLVSLFHLSESTTRYQSGLDEIALGVLLGPYSPFQLGSVALGVTPYIWKPVAEAQPYMGWIGGKIWALGEGAWTPGVLEVLIVLLFITVLLWATNWKLTFRTFSFAASFTIVLAFVCLTGLFALASSPYSALKVGWTAVALLPLVVVSTQIKPALHWFVVVALIPLAILWVRTDLLDRSLWLISREGAENSLSHSSIQPTLTSIRQVLSATPKSVTIVRGRQPITGSDRDRVLYSQIRVLVREFNLSCVGCEGFELDPSKLPYRPKCTKDGIIIRIGLSGKRRECGDPLLFREPAVEVYGRGPR